MSSSSAFESRRRKNGKIIAPLITHDNAAMVITGKRKGMNGRAALGGLWPGEVVDTRTSVCVWPVLCKLGYV